MDIRQLNVRITDDEWKQLKRLEAASGLTQTDLIRRLIQSARIRPTIIESEPIEELAKANGERG